jgi:hypothetical protein
MPPRWFTVPALHGLTHDCLLSIPPCRAIHRTTQFTDNKGITPFPERVAQSKSMLSMSPSGS